MAVPPTNLQETQEAQEAQEAHINQGIFSIQMSIN